MTTSLATTPAAIAPLTETEIRNETASGLAADLLERALQGPVDLLHITLLQILDSGLVSKGDSLGLFVDKLCRDGEQLRDQLSAFYPGCSHGRAQRLMRKCQTLPDQVNLYRQEQFWLCSDPGKLMQSEELIGAVFGFYREVNFLLRSIDQKQPDYRVEDRRGAPQRTPNPYQAIDHD